MNPYLYVDASVIGHALGHKLSAEDLEHGGAAMIAIDLASRIGELAKNFNVSRIYFLLDPKEGSWRKQVDKNYKAQRAQAIEDDPIKIWKKKVIDEAMQTKLPELLSLLEVPAFTYPYIEADDWCAACVGVNGGHPAIMVTSDKDYYQLVTPSVSLINIIHHTSMALDTNGHLVKTNSTSGKQEFWGLTPNDYLLSRCLVGDASDNLPGLIGCGPKTAEKVVKSKGIRT